MAYEVTATRRRPQRFEDLIGQEFVADTLRNSIQSGKIAHAYLFSGPRGCGKTSTARILAKALNCQEGPTASPCGKCSACTEITKGSSLDVIEIDGASNTSVNDVRQIKDEVLFPPNSCRYKIYIIDEVHMLSTSAFNALLKTIEEPPPYVIFIFATTELQKVPATIKSRCQQFNFRLVPVEKVKEQLSLAASEINVKAEDEALYWIARESGGSMRDSYTLFDQVAAFSDGEITYDKIRDKLGLVGVDRLNEMFTLCATGDVTSALTRIDEYLQNGVSIEQLITNCTDYLRSLLLIKSGIRKEALLGQAAERYSKEVLSGWNNIQIERALDIFLQLYRDIRYSLNSRYELELAVSRLCWLKDYVSAQEVKKAVEAVKPLLMKNAPAQNITPQNNVPQNNAPQSFQEVRQPVQNNVPDNKNSVPQFNMPRFSALSEEENSGGQTHPFYNGGAVPPVNKTAFGGSSSFSGYQNTDGDSYEAEDGSYAPDDSYDDAVSWSNTADAENDYLEQAASYEASLDDPLGNGTMPSQMLPVNNAVPGSLEDVQNQLVAELNGQDDNLIATVVSKTFDWEQNGNTISVKTKTPYEKIQLQNKADKIASEISRLMNQTVSLVINVQEQKTMQESRELPLEVQILRDTFKGSVVAG